MYIFSILHHFHHSRSIHSFHHFLRLYSGSSWQARASRADTGDDITTASRGSVALDKGDISDDVDRIEAGAELLGLGQTTRDAGGTESTETVVGVAASWVWCLLDGAEHGVVGWLLLVVLVPDEGGTLTGEHAWNPRVFVGKSL